MAGISKITYKGKEIHYIDNWGMNEDQIITTFKKTGGIILRDNKLHLQLINISDAFTTSGFMKVAREFEKKTKSLIKKAAIVGVTGVKKDLLEGYNLILGGKMKPFDTETEAKDYLVS